MNITPDIINDLLPVYLAGEASEDTRALVEEWLQAHPDLARSVREQASRTAALLSHLTPAPAEEEAEKSALERVRRFSRQRTYVLGFAIAYTLVPLTFTWDDRIAWVMMRDNPKQAVFFWIAAFGCWLAYYLMGRRLRTGSV